MSLQILNRATQINLDLDAAELTGDVETDAASAYIVALAAGVLVGVDTDGYVQLADGNENNSIIPLGFLVNDAAGYFYENKPALASGKVAVVVGPAIIITNKIDTTKTFTPGQKIYADTSTNKGKVTNSAPSNSRALGVSLSSASSSSTSLTILLY